ncbi:LysR family transcriptional regulator [Suipraeoptans intestinalis]|uniref:LysR family transcriptional regulator n=1 Tax=Suipraeoptans intestinalis TaxID=2606628 RepID=A0A6N7UZG3_9FIRM|nr:LysR family transcriptional regulator [Suipraeoptans intestinalis]MDD7770013.1 LysR family transcriptional regulator [Suipraeoptans intestinalis]MDY3121743.1 LysR family transcriptional regulator [Suipraeoptans intestinalis]MSR93705.1 LysR family transcriptional regulator [Suipraeoptans intestinalis]
MNLAEIETFLMIVETKNITKTAETLFVSQPTVSHRLKLLEEELGVSLLIRKKGYKQVELTTYGEEFVPIAERWLYLWQETQSLKEKQEKYYLTVGCTDTLNSAMMYDLYREMLDEADRMTNLRIKTHYSSEIYHYLEKHEIDIGFVHHYLHYKNILAEPLLSEEMYIIQSEQPEIEKEEIHTDELNKEREIYLSWETDYQIWHNQWITKGERPRMQVDTFELLFHLLSGKGMWAIAPSTVVERIQKLKQIHVSKIANEIRPPRRVTYKVTHKHMSEATLKAVQMLDKRMELYLKKKGWKTDK